jgi:hypothetical protein
MADDDLVDPLNEPANSDDLGLEDNLAPPPTDALDLEVVDEFDVSDFDEEFDDDFEEEIKGEYNLQDDQYGEDFEKEFGHFTDPEKAAARKAQKAEKAEKTKKSKGK